MHWLDRATAEPPFPELVGALTEWVRRLVVADDAESILALTSILDVADYGSRLRLLRAMFMALQSVSQMRGTNILEGFSDKALALKNGRARWFLTAWSATTQIESVVPLSLKRKIWISLSTFARSFAEYEPSNSEWQRDLSLSYNELGDIAVASGDLSGAREWFEQGLAIAKSLAASDPANSKWQRDLSFSYNKLGDIAVRSGDLGGARCWYEEGLAFAKSLADLDPTKREWQAMMSFFEDAVASI